MTILNYSPTRVARSLLIHAGDLRVNAIGTTPPDMFADVQDTVTAGNSNAPRLINPTFTVTQGFIPYSPPDAGVIMTAGYDQLIIDVQLTVNAQGQVGTLSALTLNTLRQVSMTGRPFWLMVHCDGYGQSSLSSRDLALSTALSAISVLWDQCVSFIITPQLRGFAFLSPDLNVQFEDGTVIDRLFQNTLVQSCWSLNRACTFVTCRPGDAFTTIGPMLSTSLPSKAPNTNSGRALPYSILGCSSAFRDQMVILYPIPQANSQSVSVLANMLTGVMGSRGRDPGFPLNLDVGMVFPLDETQFVSDMVLGVVDKVDSITRALAFCSALGIQVLGVSSNYYILPADRFLPPDSAVNTTGSVRVSSTSAITTVQYSDGAGGTTTRRFDAYLREVVP